MTDTVFVKDILSVKCALKGGHFKKEEKNMICKKCGKETDDDSKFCIYCGADVGQTTESVSAAYQNSGVNQTQNMNKPQPVSKKNKVGSCLTGFLLAIVLCFVGLLIIGSIAEDEEEEQEADNVFESVEEQPAPEADSSAEEEEQPKEEAEPSIDDGYTETTVDEIYEEYEKNEVRAEKDLSDIILTGKLYEVNAEEKYFIIVSMTDNYKGICFHYTESKKADYEKNMEKLSGYNVGDEITVSGSIYRFGSSVWDGWYYDAKLAVVY